MINGKNGGESYCDYENKYPFTQRPPPQGEALKDEYFSFFKDKNGIIFSNICVCK